MPDKTKIKTEQKKKEANTTCWLLKRGSDSESKTKPKHKFLPQTRNPEHNDSDRRYIGLSAHTVTMCSPFGLGFTNNCLFCGFILCGADLLTRVNLVPVVPFSSSTLCFLLYRSTDRLTELHQPGTNDRSARVEDWCEVGVVVPSWNPFCSTPRCRRLPEACCACRYGTALYLPTQNTQSSFVIHRPDRMSPAALNGLRMT